MTHRAFPDFGCYADCDGLYRRLVENSAVAMSLNSMDGRFVLANKAMFDLLGYDAEALLTKRWRDLTAPADPNSDPPGPDSDRTTKRLIHADGRELWADVSVGFLGHPDGAGRHVITQVIDITTEVAARRELEEARRLLAASADSMLDPQVLFQAVHDASHHVVDFRCLAVNSAACRYLGTTEADMIGRTLLEAMPDLAGSDLVERCAQCLADGTTVIVPDFTYGDTRRGETRHCEIRATKASDELLSVTWSDVTERILAAQQLAASEEKYRLLAENAGDAVIHARAGRFVWVSPSVQDVLAAPPEHWIGRDVWEIIPPEDLPGFTERLAMLEAGRTIQRRGRVLAADGVVHWVHLHSKPFYDANGRQDGYTSALRVIDDEVTAQQQAEDARRRQTHADALSRVLNERLTSEIQGAAEYVSSTLPGDLHGRVEVTSRYLPSQQLGGDSFHYRWIDDDLLKFYLVDVSGHGIRPALQSISVHNLIRLGSLPMTTLLQPDRVLARLNRLFRMEEQGGNYFTIWYGIYDASTRTLRYASAGHPPGAGVHLRRRQRLGDDGTDDGLTADRALRGLGIRGPHLHGPGGVPHGVVQRRRLRAAAPRRTALAPGGLRRRGQAPCGLR